MTTNETTALKKSRDEAGREAPNTKNTKNATGTKEISLIGSTGSIGRQTCEVVRRHRERFRIVSLVAQSSAELFLQQVKEFRPRYAALADKEAGEKIRNSIPAGTKFACGEEAALAGTVYGDVALVAAGGFAGLKYSLAAARSGRNLALANKETLVCGGAFAVGEIEKAKIDLMPVDSEHSALWQALGFRRDAPFRRLILTASGGPFYDLYVSAPEKLKEVTPASALKHPTWNMGAKITIDSATLLNKGYEVIEAKWLYGAPLEKISAVVQPESVVHSLAEFEDGSMLAQMSYPSMELPIQLALTYPDRLDCGVRPLDLAELGTLRFLPLERKKFPCYDLALSAAEAGGGYPCALNGAGETAVKAFLDGRIPFTAIPEVIAETLENTTRAAADGYEALCETDRLARLAAEACIARRTRG